MDIERIKERLSKLKALADRGVAGERDAAERLLREIAANNGISLDDIGSDVERKHVIVIKTTWQRTIFAQLLGLMRIEQYGDRHADKLLLYVGKRWVKTRARNRRIEKVYHTVCTDAQWIELEAKYVVLCADYERQIKAFPTAFLIANDLLMPYEPGKTYSAKEEDQYKTAQNVSAGIMRSHLNKQLSMEN